MSTYRQQGPHGPISDSELHARMMAYGLGRARILRTVAVRAAGRQTLAGIVAPVMRGAETLWTWQSRYNARRHLESLDARLLKDVGLTRHDVMRAAAKPFWKP
jgi:uncharacterized protein YjiS (DUF1127 family)